MKRSNNQSLIRACYLLFLYFLVVAISFPHCDAKRSPRRLLNKTLRTHQKNSLFLMTAAKLNLVRYLNYDSASDSPNSGSYNVSSPFTLPPYDSLAPIPLPENAPPYCIYPPNTPQTPSTTIPTPIGNTPSSPPAPFSLPPVLPIQNPPPSPTGAIPSPTGAIPSPTGGIPSPTGGIPSPTGEFPSPTGFSPYPNPPEIVPSPPEFEPSPTIPSPSEPILSPPYSEPSPPRFAPNPPYTTPSPIGFGTSPPVFLPPIVYPPPIGRPPRSTAPSIALWCVAKPSVPDPIIQEAMNYACGSGADCDSIQPSGSCFEPNTLFAHASFAFNSYWQRSKVAGGTCEFGGTAMLVTVDPSYDGCHFVYY